MSKKKKGFWKSLLDGILYLLSSIGVGKKEDGGPENPPPKP